MVFSPDGKRVDFGAKNGNKWFVVVDDKPGPEYDRIGAPVFSPDGEHAAYAAQKGDKWFVVIDGQPGPEYSGIAEGELTYQPDGSLVYLASRSGGLYRVKQR